MKFKFNLFILFFCAYHTASFAQDTLERNIIGFDLIPLVAIMVDSDVSDLEVTYIQMSADKDYRIKFNRNPSDIFSLETHVYVQNIEANTFFRRFYNDQTNYFISLGIAQKTSIEQFKYYYGVEGNFGINTGTYSTTFGELDNSFNSTRLSNPNTNYVIGVTPFLGTRFFIKNKMSIDVEFGLPINYIFGNLAYYNQDEELINYDISRSIFGFNRMLNDIRLSLYF